MSSTASESEPVAGVAQAARPTSLQEVRDALVTAVAAGDVAVRGAGTAQEWGGPVREATTVLDTTGLDQLITYNSADMTVAVGAGMPLERLQQQLQGQWIALDSPRVEEGATVGGLLATADAGPARLTYGSMRDLVIGATVVLADGTIARTGGHVIKNVAGYDLSKVFSGSLGTLGVIAELVLRTHPLTEDSGTVAASCDPDLAYGVAKAILASPLDPTAVEWSAGTLLVRFTGTASGVTRRLDRAGALMREAGASKTWALTGDDERVTWSAAGQIARGEPGDTVLRAGTKPGQFCALAHRAEELAGKVATDLGDSVEPTLSASLGSGVVTLRLRGGSAAAHAAIADPWRAEALAGTDVSATASATATSCNDGVGAGSAPTGSVTLHRRTPGLLDEMAAWGPPPPSIGVLRAVKHALDPQGRIGPGRFAPWW